LASQVSPHFSLVFAIPIHWSLFGTKFNQTAFCHPTYLRSILTILVVSFYFCFSSRKPPCFISPMLSTCIAYHIFVIWSPEYLLIRNRDHEELTVLSPPVPSYLFPPRPKYLPQHPILKHPQPMLFSQCKDRSFTPVVNRRKFYNSVYFNVYVFGEQEGKTKVSGPSGGRSSPNLICSLCHDACDSCLRCRCEVSEHWHIFKEFVTFLSVMTLSSILLDIHAYLLSFLSNCLQ
jgi:hypothetical protein